MVDIEAYRRCEQLVDNWLMHDFFEPTRVQCLNWLADYNYKEIQARLDASTSNLVFGTAGLRAKMGPGFDRLNCLTVLLTTQGLVKYLGQNGLISCGTVVIGYDGRHNSENFAHVAASVFIANNVKVYFLDKPCPTPFTPFLIVQKRAVCGIQITASHNPKDDNGYKLYWSNGAQIIPPIDAGIAECIAQCTDVDREVFKVLDPKTCRVKDSSLLLHNILDPTISEYIDVIKREVMHNSAEANRGTNHKFAYTAMHGVGYQYFERLFASFGFNPEQSLVTVSSQVGIDPEFPTVKFPNPEEKGALKQAIADAEANGCTIVLANDPDADRFTACEKQRNGSWRQFSGDELGLLFADWQSLNFKQEEGVETKGLMVASVVSSRMVQALCEARKIQFSDCLTGFKWIANESMRIRYDNKSLKHLLGFEEAIGFQLCAAVPDKDGVSAACAFAEMATRWDSLGIKLTDRIDEISKEEIGFFANINGYFTIEDPAVTKEIFSSFRKSGMKFLGRLPIVSVRDVTKGTDTSLPDGVQSHLPATPEAEMVTVYFENGATVTVRASGTEPKVKYYSELSSKISREEATATLQNVVEIIKKHFFNPSKYPVTEQASL